MYIIVGGAGKVGYYLVRELMQLGHEVLTIERDRRRCELIAAEMGDELVLHGDACEVAVLDHAGMGRADVYIAATGDDEDNLVSCQVAIHRFNVPRTIARINNPKNEHIFRVLGIESTVSATAAVLSQIEQQLPQHPLIPLLSLRGSGLELVEVHVPDDAGIVGRELRDVILPPRCLISLVVRTTGETEVATNETRIMAGDELVAVTPPENEDALREALTSITPVRAH
ncbi:MAG TPA: TrkA family potassium uptake protein [Dehalococcoidia bacterium]|nr:TrkA family potassium uptake protein [Dehalococcoidia bacterium]